MLGGMGSQLGVAVAATVMLGGFELFREFDQYRMLVFGVAMVAIVIYRPRGLVATRVPSVSLGKPKVSPAAIVERCVDGDAGMTAPVLTVEHLTMRFGGLVAVSDLSLPHGAQEITALIGPNGAGKTTLFNCITGFYKPTVGRLQLAHPDGTLFLLERMPEFRIAREARVARTFQNVRLFAGMTLLENLLVAQHNTLMAASGYHRARTVRLCRLRARAKPRHRSRRAIGSTVSG